MADPLNFGLEYRGGVEAPTATQQADQRIPVAAQTTNPGTQYALNKVLDWASGPKLSELLTTLAGFTAFEVTTDGNVTLDYANGTHQWVGNSTITASRDWTLPSGVADGAILVVDSRETTHVVTILGSNELSAPTIVRQIGRVHSAVFRRANSTWELVGVGRSGGLDVEAKPLQNFRNHRSPTATDLPGTGSGDVALKLRNSGATTLALADLVGDDEANCWGVRVRVEDSDGSDAYEDKFEFALRRAAGNIQITDSNGSRDSGATAQIVVYGSDSGYQYTVDASDTVGTLALALEDDAAQARVARVTSWWDLPEAVD